MDSLQAVVLPYLERHASVGLYGLLVACSLGFPFSKSLALVGGGVLASRGVGDLRIYLLLGTAGLVTGDLLYFLLGYVGEERVLAAGIVRRARSTAGWTRAEDLFRRGRTWAVFNARFTPYVRSVIFLLAGLSRMSPVRFLLVDLASACLVVPVFILAGYLASQNLDRVLRALHRGEVVAAVAAVGGVGLALVVAWMRRRRKERAQK